MATGSNVSGSAIASTPIATTISNNNLSEGTNTIRICVQNLASNYGSVSRSIIKDSTIPTVSITNPVVSTPIPSNSQLTLSSSDTDGTGVQKVAYTIDGNDPIFSGSNCIIATGTEYTSSISLANGNYTIKARSCDNVGNLSSIASQIVSIGPPSVPTISSVAAGNGQISIAFNSVTNATEYKVYYKDSAGVSLTDSFVLGTNSPIVVSGLTNGAVYYVRMLATHAGGDSELSLEMNGTPTQGKIIFVTASTYQGNLGGLSGADAKCNSDANKPNSSNYKAVLRGNNAIVSGQAYLRADGITPIGTAVATDTFNVMTNSISSINLSVWTGYESSSSDCQGWTCSFSLCSDTGIGNPRVQNGGWRSNLSPASSRGCSQQLRLTCVEQ